MKNILITLLFATLLTAEDNNLSLENNSLHVDNNITIAEVIADPNPTVYAALGDVVYNNVANINILQNISKYANDTQKIQDYVDDVEKTKEIGYAIEQGDKTLNKADYLVDIRALSKRNDAYIREVVSYYKSSMQYKDNDFFYEMINSGLLDTTRYRDEIMSYYLQHASDIDSAGVIQGYLDEDEELKKQATLSKKRVVTKEQIQHAKIQRIRQNDKNKEDKIQKELEDELTKTKNNILDEQLKDLSK